MEKFSLMVVLILSLTGYSQDRVNKSDQFIEVDCNTVFGGGGFSGGGAGGSW